MINHKTTLIISPNASHYKFEINNVTLFEFYSLYIYAQTQQELYHEVFVNQLGFYLIKFKHTQLFIYFISI